MYMMRTCVSAITTSWWWQVVLISVIQQLGVDLASDAVRLHTVSKLAQTNWLPAAALRQRHHQTQMT